MISSTESRFPVLASLLRSTPRAHVIASQVGVVNLLDFSQTINQSALGPYHNANHGQEVARLAYGLASMVKHDALTCKALFVAGLFHDFNHSLGRLPDAQNIQIAQQGLVQALQRAVGPRLPARNQPRRLRDPCRRMSLHRGGAASNNTGWTRHAPARRISSLTQGCANTANNRNG